MTETAAEQTTEVFHLKPQSKRLLGITVLLTQLPLMWHLPVWLSLPGMILVLAKTVPTLDNRIRIPPYFMTLMVVIAAIGIILHYNHFFARDPCVAFLFLLVGFKYSESKRNYDASLVIVLCAFLLITQFFYWQSIIAALFTIPAIFFIGLSLCSLQRGSAPMPNREMVHITSSLLLQAIPVATVLFVAIPRMSTTDWSNSGNGAATTGLSSRMSPGSIAELSKSNDVAFRVEFESEKKPAPFDLYWRGPVLDGFDGKDWYILPSTASNHYSAPIPEDSTSKVVDYTVTMEPTRNPWIMALDTPVALPTDSNNPDSHIARINNERQINATRRLTKAVRYRAKSLLTDRFTPEFAPTGNSLLTTDSNPKTRLFAKQLREKYANDSALATHLLLWFNRESFFYTLRPPKLANNSIDEFLFDSRRGFCEHYAGSFVFMLRAAGIPARVVTGYQGGELNGDYMIVRQSDAHAWAEAFLNGQWRRFDPTASVAPQRVEEGFRASVGNEQGNAWQLMHKLPWYNAARLKLDAINYAWQQFFIGFDVDSQNAIWQKLGLDKPKGWVIAVLLVGVVIVWMLLILFPPSLLKHKSRTPCEKQWTVFCRRFASSGLMRLPYESPTDYTNRVSERWPQHRRHIKALLRSYHLGRFSKSGQSIKSQRNHARTMKHALQEIGRVY